VLVETHPDKPVLIVNPTSGGGAASRYDLVGQCRARGIEPVMFERGDDLSALAAAAVEGGADVIGMAGGDGSQAAVAAVAAEHDVPYVCVPAGTRNHFAIDIGVARDDVVGALDAFVDGAERRIDLARVNGRSFVNIASMGLYGAIVQSPAYRDATLRTLIEMLPDLLGPGSEAFNLRPATRSTAAGSRSTTPRPRCNARTSTSTAPRRRRPRPPPSSTTCEPGWRSSPPEKGPSCEACQRRRPSRARPR
jgi:hypothetical protein